MRQVRHERSDHRASEVHLCDELEDLPRLRRGRAAPRHRLGAEFLGYDEEVEQSSLDDFE